MRSSSLVKRCQGGDQYLRWVASGLVWAESRWNRMQGYRELPIRYAEFATLYRYEKQGELSGLTRVRSLTE